MCADAPICAAEARPQLLRHVPPIMAQPHDGYSGWAGLPAGVRTADADSTNTAAGSADANPDSVSATASVWAWMSVLDARLDNAELCTLHLAAEQQWMLLNCGQQLQHLRFMVEELNRTLAQEHLHARRGGRSRPPTQRSGQ